jgi:hypothetical protein
MPRDRARLLCTLLLGAIYLMSCGRAPDPTTRPPTASSPATAQPAGAATASATPSALATLTPIPAPLPPLALLLAPAGADPAHLAALRPALETLTSQAGWQLETRQELGAADLTPNLRAVVALAPAGGMQELAAAAPATQFLAIGISNLRATANLSLIGPQGARPDEIGFAAGYLAALVTPEWRVGVLSLSDTAEGLAARQGFINGVIFNCGLCRQTYPPFYTYPMFVELPAGASQAEWEAAAGVLQDKAVRTLFVAPGADSQALLEYLAEAGFHLIGVGAPTARLQSHWVGSIQPGFLPLLQTLWPDLQTGKGGASQPYQLNLAHLNPDLLSPGKQRLMQALLDDLSGGFIDTGAAILTPSPNP